MKRSEVGFDLLLQVSLAGYGCDQRQRQKEEDGEGVWLPGERPGQDDQHAHSQQEARRARRPAQDQGSPQ